MKHIGNEEVKKHCQVALINLEQGCVILTGPEGVGKKSFIISWLKEKSEKYFLVEESKNVVSALSIDLSRTLKNLSLLKGEGKLFIVIDNAHRLTLPAQNALLRTFEEPLGKIVFVLISHRLNSILPTIRSRSLIFRFKLLNAEEMKEIFKLYNLNSETAFQLQEIFGGQPGKVLGLLAYGEEKVKLLLKLIFSQRNDEKIKLIDELTKIFSLEEILEFILQSESRTFLNKRDVFKLLNLIEIWYDTKTSYQSLNSNLQLTNLVLNYL